MYLFRTKFNDRILHVVSQQPYKHIFLSREDEIKRIFSLHLALQTDVWGPEKKGHYQQIIAGEQKLEPFNITTMVEHMKWCQNITSYIKKQLHSKGIGFKEINFESFYTGERENCLASLEALFDYLEFDQEIRQSFKGKIEEKIFHSSQNSHSILEYIPNYKTAYEVLQKV